MVLGGQEGSINGFDNQLNDPHQYDNPQDPASLSVVGHLRSLSIPGKLTLVYIAAELVFLLVKCDFVIAFVSCIAFAFSAAPLWIWWSRIRFSCPLDVVVRSFGLGIIVMFWAVNGLLGIPVLLLTFAIFRGFTPIVFPVVLVGVEEMVRVILAKWSKRDVTVGRETKAQQISSTATSIGYAVGFSVVMIAYLDSVVDSALGIKPDTFSDLTVAIFALLITAFWGTPLHVLSGYLVGLEVARQTHWSKAALFAFSMRSLFYLSCMWWAQSGTFSVMIMGMFATYIAICAVMVWRIKRVEATLPVEYLRRVGYLQAFGYGVLPGGEVDEVEIPSSIDVNNLV